MVKLISSFNNYFKTTFSKIIVIIVLVAVLLILVISKLLTDNEIKNIKNSQYELFAKNIKKELEILIQNKKEITSFIAITLANDSNIIKSLKENNNKSVKLKEFSLKLKNLTEFKNVWFQIIDKNGTSFYRSWTHKCGDCMLDARVDIADMIKNPKIMSTISTGKFDMTFKSMIPIYDDKKFIGIFEIITHFNSIAKQMERNNVQTIFLVDKSYKNQITMPFTNSFIDDYYVALVEPNQELIKLLKENGVEQYLNIKDEFTIDKKSNNFITTYKILDVSGKNMGYAIISKPLDSFEMKHIGYVKQNIISFIIVVILLVMILGYYLLNKHHEENLIQQHKKHEENIERNTKFLTIGQMAAGITHEINTPLTYIKGTVEMSRFDLEDMPQNEYKQILLEDNKKIMDGINRMSIIIESMKEMSQTAPAIKENTNIYATMITVLRMIYNRSKQISKIYINGEQFNIETSLSDKYNFNALVNKQKLEQVWTIIINNALDELIKIDNYDDRKLNINISSIDNAIQVTFQDNAGGISADILDKIFEPFVSNKISSGIGIGLNVAKKILDEHQATIEVENKDNGAFFKITII